MAGGDARQGQGDGAVGGGARRVSVLEAGGKDWSNSQSGSGSGSWVRGIEGGRLIEEEVTLWQAARGGEGRGTVGEGKMEEDGGDDGRVGEKGEEGHLATAGGAEQRQDRVDACEQHGPADPCWVAVPSGFRIRRSM